jgi:hypothetical protein
MTSVLAIFALLEGKYFALNWLIPHDLGQPGSVVSRQNLLHHACHLERERLADEDIGVLGVPG